MEDDDDSEEIQVVEEYGTEETGGATVGIGPVVGSEMVGLPGWGVPSAGATAL